MEFRVALACVVVIGCALCGRSMAGSMIRRNVLAEELISALKVLRVHIVCQLEPVCEALEATGNVLFAQIAERTSDERNVYAAWRDVLCAATKRGGTADALGDRERTALDRLFKQIGASGRDEQDVAIRACISSFEVICEKTAERAATIGRLYTSLGMLIGLALAVLMI